VVDDAPLGDDVREAVGDLGDRLFEARSELEKTEEVLESVSMPESRFQFRCPVCVRYVLPTDWERAEVMDYCPECDLQFAKVVVWDCSMPGAVDWIRIRE